MEINFQRSHALNNIPISKVQEQLKNVTLNCLDCKNKTAINGDLFCKKCSYTSIAYHRYAASNIPIEYWPLKMDKDFLGDMRLLNKYNELTTDLIKTFTSGTSVCFGGSHGRGKTMASTCILKKAAIKGFSCLYTTLSDVVNILIQAPNEEKYLARKELTMVDFLVIDEYDNRFYNTEKAAELYAQTLESIFRTRSQNCLSTFMCTNSPNIEESFSGPLKDSLQSLMNKMEQFPVLGEDFRKKK